jgi:hypothetical protein
MAGPNKQAAQRATQAAIAAARQAGTAARYRAILQYAITATRIHCRRGGMYLPCNRRLKDGKEHRYWNIVESKRCAGGKVVQRNVNLGEINDSQRDSWCAGLRAG